MVSNPWLAAALWRSDRQSNISQLCHVFHVLFYTPVQRLGSATLELGSSPALSLCPSSSTTQAHAEQLHFLFRWYGSTVSQPREDLWYAFISGKAHPKGVLIGGINLFNTLTVPGNNIIMAVSGGPVRTACVFRAKPPGD